MRITKLSRYLQSAPIQLILLSAAKNVVGGKPMLICVNLCISVDAMISNGRMGERKERESERENKRGREIKRKIKRKRRVE